MHKQLRRLAVFAALIFAVTPLYAHHGVSQYDLSKTITLNGRITSFDWGNPHCLIHIDVTNTNGKTEHWTLELASVALMSHYKWNKGSLKTGDEVTVETHPAKNGVPIGLSATNEYIKMVIVNGKPLPTL